MFMEVLQKLYINIPLLDAIQVSTYAKYIRDILNKNSLPSTEVVKLTEECSAAILNKLPEKKKKDQGCLTIKCTIGDQHFNHTLYDCWRSLMLTFNRQLIMEKDLYATNIQN